MAMTASIAIHLLRLEAGLQSKSVQLYGVNCAANRFSRPLKQASALHDSLLCYAAIVFCFSLSLFLFYSSIICADLGGTASVPLVLASPTSSHTQGSFRIVALPP